MFGRACISAVVFIVFVASEVSAASGTLKFCVRDVLTGYAFRATAQLEGPESLTLQTDDTGCVKQNLAAGHYRVVVSAPGYKVLKTHLGIGSGRTAPVTAMMESETLPEEERPEVLDANIIPGATLFHGYVVDGGKPLQGVKVRFVNAGVETLTDSKGHFMLSVRTPEPENPGGAGTDTLIFEKRGYKTEMFENFGIATEEMRGPAYGLEKGSGVIRHDATHKLMRKEGSATGEEPQSATPGGASLSPELYQWLGSSGTGFPVGSVTNVATAQAITVPSSINVGTGGPSDPDRAYEACSGPYTCTNVFIFPLENYVRDGLPGEWEAWWVADSLKAGSVAYRSYGAYYVANPACPEVGAHSGQCSEVYDICNTTACQKYDPKNYPSNKRSRAAVSATAGVALSRDGVNIFKAEYAAEGNLASETYATCPDGQVGEPSNPNDPWPCMKDPVCIGKSQPQTHSRGMCQRGSQRWASGKDSTGVPGDTGADLTTPRNWQCILDHYYNASSNSKTVDPNGTGDPGAGSGLRTAFMEGQPIYGKVAYEDNSTPLTIRVANAAGGSDDHLLVSPGSNPT